MVLKRVSYFSYDSDDVIGLCTKCNGELVNMPVLARQLVLTEDQKKDFEIGILKIGFCPICGQVEIV